MRFNEQFIKDAIPEANILCNKFPDRINFAIDSREICEGDIFIALKGLKTDGHNFLQDAIKNKAGGLIIEQRNKNLLDACDQKIIKNILVVMVPDAHQALMNLAAHWRAQFNYPVIGVTGSIGKTTTKALVCKMLDLAEISYATSQGNRNSTVGLALSIFNMRPEHKVAIFECGVSKRGEMAQLAKMLRPTSAVITGIAHAHMEGLGSLMDIAAEKREIFSQFREDNVGIINGDQAFLTGVAYKSPVVKFGTKTTNQVQARKIAISDHESSFVLKLYGNKYKINIPSNHQGVINNTLAAIAVGYLLEIPVDKMLKAVQSPVVIDSRFEKVPLKFGGGYIIDDCYNANPESMKAALLAFGKVNTDKAKIAVLGDMLELGETTPFWHRQIGRFLRKVPSLKRIVLVGNHVEWTKKTVPFGVVIDHVKSWQEALPILEKETQDDSLILVKGSNGMGLKNLVNALTQ